MQHPTRFTQLASVLATLTVGAACGGAQGPYPEPWESPEYAQDDPVLSPQERAKIRRQPRYPSGGITPYERSYSGFASSGTGSWDYQDANDNSAASVAAGGMDAGSVVAGPEEGGGTYMTDADGEASSSFDGYSRSTPADGAVPAPP